jgi:hypothetical protein
VYIICTEGILFTFYLISTCSFQNSLLLCLVRDYSYILKPKTKKCDANVPHKSENGKHSKEWWKSNHTVYY